MFVTLTCFKEMEKIFLITEKGSFFSWYEALGNPRRNSKVKYCNCMQINMFKNIDVLDLKYLEFT